jgi:type I restriction enzyme S subunit
MNETLEALARALFQSWFVDFDPVRAKAEGRQPYGMDAATAALFPDSFEESDLGQLPQGWRYAAAQEVAHIGIGKTPPRKEPEWFSEDPNDVPWVSIRDMGSSGLYVKQTSEYLTEEAMSRFNVRKVPENTVLLSFKLTVGRVVISDTPLATNEAIAHFNLIAEQALTTEFIYLYLAQFNYDSLGSTSSIATAVNSLTIKEMPILVPSIGVVEAFTKSVENFFGEIRANQKASRSLTEIRDALLPRLLSGEIELLRDR